MKKRRMERRLRSRTDLDQGLLNKGWHSKSYHRHFEGYTEVETTNDKGKTVIRRVYTGEYRRLELPKGKRITLRMIYLALLLVIWGLFFLAASRNVGANRSWYVAIAQMLVLCSLGYSFIKLLGHATAPRNLTIGEWKASSLGLAKSCQFCFWSLELTALLTLLYLILKGENWGLHLLCIGVYAVAGLLAILLNRMEANAPYITFPSTEPAPEEGTYIDA